MGALVVVMTLLYHVLLLHYAAAINVLQSGVEVDFDISTPNMCYDGEFPLKLILNVPIGRCVVECGTRKSCQGLSYRMNGGLIMCKLLNSIDETEFTAGECALVKRSDIEVKNLPCDNICAVEQTCDVATGICVFKECEFPSIDNGIILGNRNDIGSRLRVKCNSGYAASDGRKSMVCENDGSWSELPICEVIDECTSSPCHNGGTCTDAVNSFSCTCLAGYDGTNCETDIDECANTPCLNGGTCTDAVNSYNCTCVAGYEGNNCGTDIDECADSPCQNDGTCTDAVSSYSCTCVAGYDGTNCETDIDECASNPCQHGGTCTDAVNSYSCTCGTWYDRTNCQNDLSQLTLTHYLVNGNQVMLTCEYNGPLDVKKYKLWINWNVCELLYDENGGCTESYLHENTVNDYTCPARNRVTFTITVTEDNEQHKAWCIFIMTDGTNKSSNKYTIPSTSK